MEDHCCHLLMETSTVTEGQYSIHMRLYGFIFTPCVRCNSFDFISLSVRLYYSHGGTDRYMDLIFDG